MGKASEPMLFDTGGGEVAANQTLMCSGGTPGLSEMYRLPESPFAVSCGIVVEEKKQPFIWIPNHLPFHCTDMSKLKVICPTKFRRYANHLEHNVPIFREKLVIGARNKNARATCKHFSAAPVVVADSEDEALDRALGNAPETEEQANMWRQLGADLDDAAPATPTLDEDQVSLAPTSPRESSHEGSPAYEPPHESEGDHNHQESLRPRVVANVAHPRRQKS